MTEDPALRSRYLSALTGLTRGIAHDVRSHLGNVALQLDLIAEILAREEPADAAIRDRIAAPVARAKRGLERLEQTIGPALGALRDGGAGDAAFDLREPLRHLEALLAPAARERRVAWTVALPDSAVPFVGARGPLFEALAITLAETLGRTPEGGRLALGLAAAGGMARLTLEGGAPVGSATPDWAPAQAVARAHRGRLETATGGGRIVLELPLAGAPS